MNISGIYKIQSKIYPERDYIGSAVNINKRWMRHKWELRSNRHSNNKLQRHCNKYGIADLLFSVLYQCSKEELIISEQYYLDRYVPSFNFCLTAGSKLGIKLSKEQILKTSMSNKGQKRSDDAKYKMRMAKLGKPNLACIGVPRSEETKEKLRIASTGKPSYNKGKPSPYKGTRNRYSEETLAKMSKSAKNRNTSAPDTSVNALH